MPYGFTRTQNIKTKTKSKQTVKYKLIEADDKQMFTRGKEGRERAKWLTGVKCMMTDRNQTFDGELNILYTDIKL